jgi:hypothetical protein
VLALGQVVAHDRAAKLAADRDLLGTYLGF